MFKFYVYVHKTMDGRVFYVGKGFGARDAETKKRSNKWKAIVQTSGGHIVERVAQNLSECGAFELERRLIAIYGRANLCNLTDGGEGSSGYRHTDEAKTAVGDANRGRPSLYKGVPRSDEVKRKVSASKRGVPHASPRAKASPESYARAAAALRGVPKSALAKSRMSAAKIGTTIPQEVRDKIAESVRRYRAERKANGTATDP